MLTKHHTNTNSIDVKITARHPSKLTWQKREDLLVNSLQSQIKGVPAKGIKAFRGEKEIIWDVPQMSDASPFFGNPLFKKIGVIFLEILVSFLGDLGDIFG